MQRRAKYFENLSMLPAYYKSMKFFSLREVQKRNTNLGFTGIKNKRMFGITETAKVAK